MNILIIHGWMHSSKLYVKLKHDLEEKEKYSVFLYELAGFGSEPVKYKSNIIESYTKDLNFFLLKNKIDLIIAHSLGGNVLLRATEKIKINRILLSPEYKGIGLLKFVMPLTVFGVQFLKFLKHNNILTTFILKVLSLFTINSWSSITDDVVNSAREADPEVAIELLKEMYNDNYVAKESELMTFLIIGEKDRIITKEKMLELQKDLGRVELIVINGIGHTAVLEDYNSLYNYITRICKGVRDEC